MTTELLILGGAHLNAHWTDATLSSTLTRLRAWSPDAVAVELLSGPLAASFTAQGSPHADLTVGGLLWARRGAALVPSESTASAEARALHPNTPAAERVLAWLAAWEPVNALRHWTPDLLLPDAMHAFLHELNADPGETHRLALPLARTLNLPRLHHVDDHTGLHLYARADPHLNAFWSAPTGQAILREHPAILDGQAALRDARDAQDYWTYLSVVNGDAHQEALQDLEVGSYLHASLPGGAGHTRVAQWDARNLLIAARLRLVTGEVPGGRVLCLLGASHARPVARALSSLAPDLQLVQVNDLP